VKKYFMLTYFWSPAIMEFAPVSKGSLMDTPMAIEGHSRARGVSPESLRQERHKRVPMGHMGTGWDTAKAAVFLCSSDAEFITGVMLPVDGGMSARIG
jgi:NAD(P)-dependent dehydrogenase (short-subunit alcohol dehydrogenase family)